MTQPDRDVLRARNAAMREQVASLTENLERQTAALADAQSRAAAVVGRASSPDGAVRVTVNATGVVTDVRFEQGALARTTPERLSASVTQLAQQAAAHAREQTEELLAPMRRNVPDLPDLFPGAPSLASLLPSPVPVPDPAPQAAPPPAPSRRPPPPVDDEDLPNRSGLLGGNP